MEVIRVALDVPIYDLFDYLIPNDKRIAIGDRVIVPFGHRQMSGIVLEIGTKSQIETSRLKTVLDIPGDMPPLSPDIIELVYFCAEYYHYPIGEIVHTAIPSLMRQARFHKLKFEQEWLLTDREEQLLSALKHSPSKLKLYQILKARPISDSEARIINSQAHKILQAWQHQGHVKSRPIQAKLISYAAINSLPKLNLDQERTVNAILEKLDSFNAWLIQGITGSGKTEIYLRLIQKLLEHKKQVLMMVPEISLTPQLTQRIKERFSGLSIVILHSKLSPVERFRNWLLAASGHAKIVLTTRLGIFTPLPELGLIIIDEEHDSSFKQQEGIRYHARDIAVLRSKNKNIPILLGSATPSLESLFNAQKGRYHHILLPERAHPLAKPPKVSLIDIRPFKLLNGLSDPVITALKQGLTAGEQSMVFLNRRGFAPVLYCPSCGWISPCKRCSAKMVVHLNQKTLQCHHCGSVKPIPEYCPECGDPDLRPVGIGTQRLENTLANLLPQARILRIDRDNTQGKNTLANMLHKTASGEIDILIGTQMLAKGHDFPNLTLVVILNVDSALFSADFRSQERLFSQLLQVAGRTGRAHLPGRVLIQTQFPEHSIFKALQRQDFTAFAKTMLDERKALNFPPYTHFAILRAEASKLEDAIAFLNQARNKIHPLTANIIIFDPVPALMYRQNGMERAQLLFQATNRSELHQFLSSLLPQLTRRSDMRWHIDIDPIEV
ncbi:MAG: primosomal protein N' [Pseudomonadota bacterium]|nr:primosomal protein N' [Pseudomonadota bacterium]